jgi:hypothetical protein
MEQNRKKVKKKGVVDSMEQNRKKVKKKVVVD